MISARPTSAPEPTEVMPRMTPRTRPMPAAPAFAARVSGTRVALARHAEQRPPEDREGHDEERRRDDRQQRRVEAVAVAARAARRRAGTPAIEPGTEPKASHLETPRSTVPERRWRQPPTRLGDRAVGEVGADRDDRLHAGEEDQQRRHQRAAADPGQADQDSDAEPEGDDERVDHATCSPHSTLSVPAQRPLAAAAGLGAGRAADRGVALVVQRVVGQVALVDALPQVALGPVGERVVLPHRALVVELDELRRTRRTARWRAWRPARGGCR